MFCFACGEYNTEQARFCKSCGNSLTDNVIRNNNTPQASFRPSLHDNYQLSQQEIYNHHSVNKQTNPSQQYAPYTPPYSNGVRQRSIPQKPIQTLSNNNYHKIGGFLLVIVIISIIFVISYIVSLMIGTGMMQLLRIRSNYAYMADDIRGYINNYSDVNLIIAVCSLSVGILIIIFLVNLFQRKPTFLRFAQLAILLHVLFTICNMIIGSIYSNKMDELLNTNQFFAQNFTYISIPITIFGIVVIIAINIFFTLYMCKSIRVRTYMGNDMYMSKAIFAFKNQPLIQSFSKY